MDEAYASPDSDGHASLPSPTDSTFDLSQLPLRRRGRPQESMLVSSSFVRSPEDDESDNDSEYDQTFNGTFNPNTLILESHRILQTSSSLKDHSKVLTSMNSKNEDNTPRTTPRRTTQIPYKSQAISPSQGENINPKQGQSSGRKPLLPRLVVQEPDYGSGYEEEDAFVDKTVSTLSDPAGEAMTKDGATQSMGFGLGTLFGDAYERSLDTLPSPRDARAGLSKRDATHKLLNGVSSPPPAGPPLFASPQGDYPGPDDKSHLSPGTPRLRHLDWLSSDSIDDADDESVEIPTGHSSRLKKAQAQRISDDTAFLGGDEASISVRDMSMNNEMLSDSYREGPAGEEDKSPQGSYRLEEKELAAISEELAPLRLTLTGTTRVASGSDAETINEPANGAQDSHSTNDGAGDIEAHGDSQHSLSSAGAVEREVQRPTPSSGEPLGPIVSTPFVRELVVGQSQVPDAAAVKEPGSNFVTSTLPGIMSPMEPGPSTGFLPKEITALAPEFVVGNSTFPQYPIGLPNGTDRTARPASSNGNSRQSFASDATIRRTTSPGHLQENSTVAALEMSPRSLFQGSPGGDIDPFTETNLQNSLYPEGFVAQSTPKDYYGGYDIWAIKKSGRGRRVSMNTPPSTLGRSLSGSEILNNLPELSSLGSGFSFPSQPLRYEEWNPESVAREFTPPFPVEGVNGIRRMGLRLQGVDAPHNTPTPAIGKGSGPPAGWREGKGVREGKGRARSKSDPVENKVGGVMGKGLFTPGRVEKKKGVELGYASEEEEEVEERHGDSKSLNPGPRMRSTVPGIGEKSVFSDESESPGGDNAEPGVEFDNDINLDDDDGLDLSGIEEDEVGGRHWSGFTQDFQSSFARASLSRDTSATADQGGLSYEPSSLSLGNIEFRVHTPVSIGESKDISHSGGDVGDRSNKTLWIRMAQAEAENNRFRKLLKNNNIKIAGQDMGSSGNLIIPRDNRDTSSSSRNSDYNSSDDVGSLRRRVAELESLLGRRDAELRSEGERRDMLATHWRTQYNDAQNLAIQNNQRAISLENHVKDLEQQAAVESINHDREINEVVSKLHGEKQHNRQKSVSLEDRVKFFEQRVLEVQEAHRRDVEDKEGIISHLRHALSDRRGSMESTQTGVGADAEQDLISELEGKLLDQQQAHEAQAQATEDKYTNLLSEKDGLVRHLQAELDEMVNLMPVDHGSSRMIDEEEAEDWLDEKSREISQYYDDGLDQIITELHGTGEREDFEEAVEEAEMSLRRVADEAGLDEPLDKATLAAFGIRQLRAEYLLLKRLVIESEGRVKDLMQANDELDRRGAEAQEKLGFAEDERDALRTAVEDAESASKMLADQFDALRAKLQEAENHIHQLVAEHDALNQRCSETEEQVKSLEVDKVSLQRLVTDTKRLNDMLKSQATEAEQRNRGSEEEILGLRRQLAEEKDHISVVETETITFRHQLTEWEETAMSVGKQRDEFQAQLRNATDRAQVISREKEELSRKLLEAVKGRGDTKETDSLKGQVKELQDKLKALGEQHSTASITATQLGQKLEHSDQSALRLSAEKEFLKAELEIAVAETKAARGRFAQLLHETAEKEAKWAGLKQEMERGAAGRSGNSVGTVEAYRKALALIVQEIEKETFSSSSSASASEYDQEELGVGTVEGIQNPELVKVVIRAFRARDRRIAESEERNNRYKGAAKKWMKENEKKRGRVEELVAEVRELGLRLKAEKKSSDEKMGQLILALRRGE